MRALSDSRSPRSYSARGPLGARLRVLQLTGVRRQAGRGLLEAVAGLEPALRLEVVRLAELVGGPAGPARHVDLRQRVAGVVEELALLLHRDGLGPDVAGVALDLEVRHVTSP